MHDLQIIAHRGASGRYPENTLLAFRRALDMGANWLELDVQRVEDKLVVFHDETLERTTNGQGLLAELSLRELRQLDAGAGEKIPLLREVLELARGKSQVNIELKGPASGVAVADFLASGFSSGWLSPVDILASSLRLDELASFQRQLPQVRCAPILEELPADLGGLLTSFRAWSVHLHKGLITKDITRQAAQLNCLVFAWTVNRLQEARMLKDHGVAGIFTDYPESFIIKKI